ncbi:MAG: hypothetical protein ABEJ42_04710 [Halobacteriaceae archaeon]
MSEPRHEEGRAGVRPWSPLERYRATAFLTAGVLFAGFAVRNGVIAFGGGLTEWQTMATYAAFVVPGELAASLGLLGCYRRFEAGSPRLTRAAAVVVGVVFLSMVGFAVTTASILAGSAVPEPSPVNQLLYLVSVLGTVLGFVLFGVSGLRGDRADRRLAVLLLVPPATYVVMIAGIAAGFTPEWSTFLLSAVQAVAHLAVGVTLRGGVRASARDSPTPGGTGG